MRSRKFSPRVGTGTACSQPRSLTVSINARCTMGYGVPAFRVFVGQCQPERLKSPPKMTVAFLVVAARWAESTKAFMLSVLWVWG